MSADSPADPLAAGAASLLACLREGVALFDLEGRLLATNPAAAAMLGQRGRAGAPMEELVPAGSELHRLLLGSLAGEAAGDRDLQHHGSSGRGGWLRAHTAPLEDGSGVRFGVVLALEEISELRRAEHGAWQVEKMSALGRLAASVAHEVCNPLSAIDIQLQLLQQDLATLGGEVAQRADRRLDIARTEMRRLEGIVRNFLRFSRPPALHLQRMSPNDLVRHIHALVEPEARERRIELILDLDDSVPPIVADENLLSQALLNILINAFQVVQAEPRVVLRSRLDLARRQAVLAIEDNGTGIPPDCLERIFEFYYTTKEEGTGLGLSIAQRIVHQHGGTVEVDSQEGVGTTVAMHLPLNPAHRH